MLGKAGVWCDRDGYGVRVGYGMGGYGVRVGYGMIRCGVIELDSDGWMSDAAFIIHLLPYLTPVQIA